MDELTREFLIESQEGLDRMERCLTDLEGRPHDAALLGDIFRSVHTIKGTTGFLGFKRLEKLAHAGENLLGLLRDGKLTADPRLITALLQLLDGLRSILRSIESDGSEGESDDNRLIAHLEELQKTAPPPAGPTAAAPPASPVERPQPAASIRRRSSRPKSRPESGQKNRPKSKAEPVPAPTNEIPVPLAEADPAPVSIAQQPPEPPAAFSASADSEAESPRGNAVRISSAAESTLRVDVVLLNRMMNLVGELVLTRNQVLQATAADPNMTLLSRRLDMVTADLRESVMKARMQPVSNIFSKIPRIVRDLSQTLGRRVRLEVEGQDTELDKSLLEAIKDPLTHAVRNSLDHGIEPPAVRQAAGKNPEGTLKLRASHQGSHVIIEISDDGAGIDPDKVRRKAVERGAITPERAAQMNERELLQLIFVPGFSTAAAVTNVSGRGVGMDVVRTNVEKIGGKVELDSRVGKGTTLRLRIPLTLAIIPALIVRSLGQSFAVPQGSLSELVHIPPEHSAKSIEWIEGAPLYRLRGNLLPLAYLDRLLRPETESFDGSKRDSFIAVLDADGRRFGLVVEGLEDPEEIVVKPLSSVLKEIGMYSGATVLGNGELALILDPGAIAAKAGIAIDAGCDQIHVAEEEQQAAAAGSEEFLLVEVAGRRAAVPLADVLRIEQLSLERIEYVGCRPVLNFEGQLMPVEDSGGILTASAADRKVIVVVCRERNRHVGIVVSHVLDVAAGGELLQAGTNQHAAGVTMLKDRVTGVVELDAIPPLPVDEIATSACNPVAETFA
jgi:two-component system chemotaxis sensor kinase CheA